VVVKTRLVGSPGPLGAVALQKKLQGFIITFQVSNLAGTS
jgi:hypothetical protein